VNKNKKKKYNTSFGGLRWFGFALNLKVLSSKKGGGHEKKISSVCQKEPGIAATLALQELKTRRI